MVNVAVQIETIIAHPLVGTAYGEGRIDVIGLFYDIPRADVLQVPTALINSPSSGAETQFASMADEAS
jgi:carbonic anhydrase